jgi:hypothetical protein
VKEDSMPGEDEKKCVLKFRAVIHPSWMVQRSQMSVPPDLGFDGAYIVPSARECSARLP